MSTSINELTKEGSLYLQQHASNPVHWKSFSNAAFEQAKNENKLVLISIGYSACHWCHVMEHESFENEEVAKIMNEHFVCIKVDREERPDVDQIYMAAVQIMTDRGGWPLNCFTLPDGKPIYGGTYFPKDQWIHILQSLVYTYEKEPEKVLEYANELTEGISKSELIDQAAVLTQFPIDKIEELILRWTKKFDIQEGGPTSAPKFPLPNNHEFLLRYALIHANETVLKQVELTLQKMARGGIYDQIRGGFARYSVDMLWKVPHFEKMLYDNGQLLSLYAAAYQNASKSEYATVLKQTTEWLYDEMLSPEGGLYSAVDADSEGVEGKFYCWEKEEFEKALLKDQKWALEYYNINQRGYWEDDFYILLRTISPEAFAKKLGVSDAEFKEMVENLNDHLLSIRAHKVRPQTDKKIITSWNALALSGLIATDEALKDSTSKVLIQRVYKFLSSEMIEPNFQVLRNYNQGKASIPGFLEDYAALIQSFIDLYLYNLNVDALALAKNLTEYVLRKFKHPESGMFYFSEENEELIARKMELHDNVMPSSNSIMAKNLCRLGMILDHPKYTLHSQQMVSNIADGMEMYGSGYSNWADLYLHFSMKTHTILVIGEHALEGVRQLKKLNSPSLFVYGCNQRGTDLFRDKWVAGETLYYYCFDQTCSAPTKNLQEILDKLDQK
ncbi:MAG: thioredoxin domain-containing protein [Bacteroidetes bacterium]|nr:thioredoxin domain-containing protein [Bacteroidota bacterium]